MMKQLKILWLIDLLFLLLEIEKCPKEHDIIFFTKVYKFEKNIYD